MTLEEIIHDVVYIGSMGAGIGCGLGFVVIIVDYVLTSVISMLKGGV